MDHVLSFGERNAAFIISHALKKLGFDAEYLDARKIIHTDASHGNASVDFAETKRLLKSYYKDQSACQIVTGFIASAPEWFHEYLRSRRF